MTNNVGLVLKSVEEMTFKSIKMTFHSFFAKSSSHKMTVLVFKLLGSKNPNTRNKNHEKQLDAILQLVLHRDNFHDAFSSLNTRKSLS